MNTKLQELTDRLYEEGLSKGREEGERIIEEARLKAGEIVRQAQFEADRITTQAREQADRLKSNVEADLAIAARESISVTKQEIEKLITSRLTSAPVEKVLTEDEFTREIIRSIAGSFNPENATDLEMVLPEKISASTVEFIRQQLPAIIGKGVEISFSKKIGSGFTIAPKGENWFISFTGDDFSRLIASYIRPATRKILFGE